MRLIKHGIPLFIFLILGIFLWRGLSQSHNLIPSPLIDKPAPAFKLPSLLNDKKITSNADFLGHITLVNVWASWCYACSLEHNFLLELKENSDIVIYGLNYKDEPTVARKWLESNGNPYQVIAADVKGDVGINWGVYGTPETFILDKKGVIRYKYVGELTALAWEKEFIPLLDRLRKETS